MEKKQKQRQKVRREDVAKEAGVSSAAVSYVLNGTKRLSSEVEERVLETAKRLNYLPNRIAQSLAGSKSHTLAFMTADITNVYQLDVIKGMQEAALKNDYIVYIFDAFGNVDRYINHLITRRVDGIFVSAAPDFLSDELLCELRDAGIKVLADFSRSTYLPDVSYIMSDMYDGFMQAVAYLKELGHRNIGYLSAFDESCYYDVRLPAFKIAMRKLLDAGVPAIEYGGWPYTTSEELGGRLMERMMDEHPEVTAVIATNDLMAIGAMKAAKNRNKRVPEDYSVIGVDNIGKSRQCEPPLTTLDQSGKAYGARIFQILYDNIMQDTTGKYIEPMRLLKRGSTAPVSDGGRK